MSRRNHRENGDPTTRNTRTIAASGSALDATTKTRPKRRKTTATAPPDPASAKPRNRDPTTTDLPGQHPLLPRNNNKTKTKKSRSPSQTPRWRDRNPHPRGQRSTSTPGSAKRGTRSGWRGKSSARRGRWWGRWVVVVGARWGRKARDRDKGVVGAVGAESTGTTGKVWRRRAAAGRGGG